MITRAPIKNIAGQRFTPAAQVRLPCFLFGKMVKYKILRIKERSEFMLKKRGAGVLLHISSMPSDYGVGVFDKNVIHFIDKIADMGFTYWQVLPFNPIDGANSPYCSPSAFAGNYLFIDPKSLY